MARKIFILFIILLTLVLIERPWPTQPEIFTAPPSAQKLEQIPQGNIRSNGYLYFYHSHRENEHGHFHIFISNEKTFTHLFAISLDDSGTPQAFFTTNKSVTGETPIKEKELLKALHNFQLSDDNPTSTFLNNLIKTYKPHLEEMLAVKPAGRRHQEVLQLLNLSHHHFNDGKSL